MISRQELYSLAGHLNRLTSNRYNYTVEFGYGKPRLYSHHGSVEISPRLSVSALYDWMHAYIAGIEIGYQLQAESALTNRK